MTLYLAKRQLGLGTGAQQRPLSVNVALCLNTWRSCQSPQAHLSCHLPGLRPLQGRCLSGQGGDEVTYK